MKIKRIVTRKQLSRLTWNYQEYTNYTSITNLKPGEMFGIGPVIQYRFICMQEIERTPEGAPIFKAWYFNLKGKKLFTYVWNGWRVFVKPQTMEALK